jgi:hypothetical protein
MSAEERKGPIGRRRHCLASRRSNQAVTKIVQDGERRLLNELTKRTHRALLMRSFTIARKSPDATIQWLPRAIH